MSVNRYEFEDYGTNEDDGRYVTYEDYVALEARCAALAAENAGLKNALEWLYETVSSESVSIPDEKYSSVTNAAQVLSETPATEAVLAEVRAQGVEMFAAWNDKHIKPGVEHKESLTAVSHAARGFAGLLRKGVQS